MLVLGICRKKKAVHKTTTTDDKRLQNTLKRLGVNTIPGIEEVNIFKDDTAIHFVNPKGMSMISPAVSKHILPASESWFHICMACLLSEACCFSLSHRFV